MFQLFSPDSIIGRWLGFLFDALLISIAWAVCCLPVFTIGASTAALHRVAFNWMRRRADCDLKTFFAAFKDNFKGGTAIWLMLLVPLVMIVYSAWAVWIALVPVAAAVKWMILVAALVWTATAIYAFSLQAVFENPPVRTIFNALRIALSHIVQTVILVAMIALVLFCTLVLPYGAIVYMPFCAFLSARPVWGVFERVIKNPNVTVEGAELPREETD